MELGEKLQQARLEAGLSQRQLCGEEITRNMLSQIENGTARPSMTTLQYLAARLGRPVSFFLEESALHSPNQNLMESARRLFDGKNYAAAALVLSEYRSTDAIYDRERQLLEILCWLSMAEAAIAEGKLPFARELLEKAGAKGKEAAYYSDDLERRRCLLLSRIPGQAVWGSLPSLDEELLLRAESAMAAGDFGRAAHLLEAAEDHSAPRWCYLRGESYLAEKHYQEAARCFEAVQTQYPRETAEKLEICYRELGDFQKAYFYACKQRM